MNTHKRQRITFGLLLVGILCPACRPAQPGAKLEAPPATSGPSAATAQPDRDRRAILGMAGTYAVTFHFEETTPLAKGYELKPVKDSGAFEHVIVIQDQPNFISLQHILLMGEGESQFVLKHWRQDWRYEPKTLLRFVGGNTWQVDKLSQDQAKGQWSQTVYQVDDTPRYAGLGRWRYLQDVAEWTADRAWRPLPRRDMTTRSDYHVIDAVNRHVVKPDGWTHEQDNTKIVLREPAHWLVREQGINTYRKTSKLDPSKAEKMWQATQEFWAQIRKYWQDLEQSSPQFSIAIQGETSALYMPLLEFAQSVQDGKLSTQAAVAQAKAKLDEHVTRTPAPLQQRLRPAQPPAAKASR